MSRKKDSGFRGKFGAKAVHIWQDKETGAWNFSFRPIDKWTANDLVIAMRAGMKELTKLQAKRRRKMARMEAGGKEGPEEVEVPEVDNKELEGYIMTE